jgi:predicted GNAT family acetyltransferase
MPGRNLVWESLVGPHTHLGRGNRLARLYDPAIAPFGALRDDGDESADALGRLLKPGQEVCLIGQDLQSLASMERISQSYAHQMFLRNPVAPSTSNTSGIRQLGAADVPQMVALTDLVFPGFFRPGTVQMGEYFGTFEGQLLIAIAGERLAFKGHREISAVCTHPDYQRRGHAAGLLHLLMERIAKCGEIAFLHVGSQNDRARTLYENLGFVSENLAEVNFYRRTA